MARNAPVTWISLTLPGRAERRYVREDLDTAWLLLREVTSGRAVRHLIDEWGWERAKALDYILAASHWDGKD